MNPLTSHNITKTLRSIYRAIPESIRKNIGPLAHKIRIAIDPTSRNHRKYLYEDYLPYGVHVREDVFRSITHFCHINRPIDGYYFEFGCHSARTMKLCWKHTKHLFNWTYVGFDSFEGLPDISEIDRQQIWAKGRLKTDEEDFISILTATGMPRDRLITVKGFYDQSLTTDLAQRLLPMKAAVIYVDCDLYMSTVPVLNFIKDFLQPGTIIVFDDWNCFIGDPDKGEKRAWMEFRSANPTLHFETFVNNGELASFIFIRDSANV